MTKNLQETDAEDMTMESFKVFDRDNSGFIGASELHRVFKILGQDFQDYEIEAMIKAADTDGDGLVGYDDFIKMMNLGENWLLRTKPEPLGYWQVVCGRVSFSSWIYEFVSLVQKVYLQNHWNGEPP